MKRKIKFTVDTKKMKKFKTQFHSNDITEEKNDEPWSSEELIKRFRNIERKRSGGEILKGKRKKGYDLFGKREWGREKKDVEFVSVPTLMNLGNTCYVNVVFQMLFYCTGFVHNAKVVFTEVLDELDGDVHIEIFVQFWSVLLMMERVETGSNVKLIGEDWIRRFMNSFCLVNKRFELGVQHDANDFLIQLFNSFETLSSSVTDYFQSYFCSEIVSIVNCLMCENTSKKQEKYFHLSLHIQSGKDIQWCIEQFLKDERLKDQEKYFCENCAIKTEAIKSFRFEKLPRVLILQLNRFTFQSERNIKITDIVDCPLELSIREKESIMKFELKSIISHRGEFSFCGHYTISTKLDHNCWITIDDSKAYKEQFKQLSSTISTPYLIIYEQIEHTQNI